jgi:hypothetical protein
MVRIAEADADFSYGCLAGCLIALEGITHWLGRQGAGQRTTDFVACPLLRNSLWARPDAERHHPTVASVPYSPPVVGSPYFVEPHAAEALGRRRARWHGSDYAISVCDPQRQPDNPFLIAASCF